MVLHIALANALNLPEESGDEEASLGIQALLNSAIEDENPRMSLSEIFHLVTQSGSAPLLDPLNALPSLVPSRDPAAKDLISLIGECSSAKEVIMAIQEAVERLKSSLDKEDDGDEDQKGLPPPAQLVTLVELYSSSVPRLKLRRKPASETIQPLLSELEAVVELAGRQASRDDGRALISGTSILAKRVASWVKTSYNVSGDEVMACNNILKSMMNCTLVSCSHCIHSSIGQRSFERCFPRLTIRSAIEPGWEAGEKSVLDVVSAYEALGISTDLLVTVPSTSSLIILAYSKEIDSLEPSRLLSSIFSILLASLQSNFALDESLSILLKTLHRLQITSPNELSPDIIIPLCTILPFVASHHPDPVVRHQAFRILSMLLSSSPAQLRLQVLNELTTDSNSPQMQIAAVSLVKEAVLDAITPSMSTRSVFASPVFLQVFGPTLLRPSPPDLFSSSLSLQEFQDSPEPPRLVECLALYYIILQRDKLNQTGVRDPDTIWNVERNLLAPLRLTLAKWMDGADTDHMHDIMPLVSLKMSLERVDSAVAALRAPPT